MQKPVTVKQLSWITSESFLTIEKFIEFALDFQKVEGFGQLKSSTMTISGGALPVQLTGEIVQVQKMVEWGRAAVTI